MLVEPSIELVSSSELTISETTRSIPSKRGLSCARPVARTMAPGRIERSSERIASSSSPMDSSKVFPMMSCQRASVVRSDDRAEADAPADQGRPVPSSASPSSSSAASTPSSSSSPPCAPLVKVPARPAASACLAAGPAGCGGSRSSTDAKSSVRACWRTRSTTALGSSIGVGESGRAASTAATSALSGGTSGPPALWSMPSSPGLAGCRSTRGAASGGSAGAGARSGRGRGSSTTGGIAKSPTVAPVASRSASALMRR